MDYSNIKCRKEEIDGNECRFYLWKEGERPLIVIGLNPSTADETTSDATIRKIMGFIKKWDERTSSYHFDSFIMLNLYPLIETSPAELNARHKFNYILHEKNMEIISLFLDKYTDAHVLLCYGDSIESIKWLKSCRNDILRLLGKYEGISLLTFGGLTNKKNPRHPCRLAYSTDPNLYQNPLREL